MTIGLRSITHVVAIALLGLVMLPAASYAGWYPSTVVGSYPGAVSLARATDGSTAIVDAATKRVVRLDATDQVRWVFSNPAGLDHPSAAVIAADDSVFVTDSTMARMLHIAADGSSATSFTSPQVHQPCGIALATDTSLLVLDCGTNQVHRFQQDGTYLATYLGSGTTYGKLSSPTDIEVAGDGSVWIAEKGTERVQHFDASLTSIGAVGVNGMSSGTFFDPRGIDVAADGSLFVAAADDAKLLHYGTNDAVLDWFGASSGDTPTPVQPLDVLSFGSSVMLINRATGRVERWSYDAGAPQATASVTYQPGALALVTVTATDAGVSQGALTYSFDGGATFGASNSYLVPVAATGGTVAVIVRDAAGMRTSLSVPIDVVGPTIARADRGARSRYANAGDRIYRFDISDAVSGVVRTRASFRGTVVNMSNGIVDLRRLPEGTGRFHVLAEDAAGNRSDTWWVLTIDRTPPDLEGIENQYVLGPYVDLDYTDEISGPKHGTLRVPLTINGSLHLKVQVKDRAGNVRTRRVTLQRHLSLASPEYNSNLTLRGSHGHGFTPGADAVRNVFRFIGAPYFYGNSAQTGPLVKEVQWRLQLFGDYPCKLPLHGRLDVKTIRAIKRFQRRHDLPAIATVGPRTRAALDAELLRYDANQPGRCD